MVLTNELKLKLERLAVLKAQLTSLLARSDPVAFD
jgi:hypothetical protein